MDDQTDIYAKAASELAEIDGQIAALEKRRTALRQFVDLGRKLYAAPGFHGGDQLAVATMHESGLATRLMKLAVPATASITSRENSLKARVLGLSKRAIRERGPLSTPDLVQYIESAGVQVTGAHKPTTVSVILSRSDEFKNIRGVGWTLVESPQKELTP